MTWEPEAWDRQTDRQTHQCLLQTGKSGGRTAPRLLNHDATASPRSLGSPFLVPLLAMTNQVIMCDHHLHPSFAPSLSSSITSPAERPQSPRRLCVYSITPTVLPFHFPFPSHFPLALGCTFSSLRTPCHYILPKLSQPSCPSGIDFIRPCQPISLAQARSPINPRANGQPGVLWRWTAAISQ
jgi:hypothetical protein